MNKMRWLTWYGILHKRLLKKPGFLVILCAIIMLTVMMTVVSRADAGFVHIAIAAEEQSPETDRVIERLKNTGKIIRFTVCATPQEAVDLVKSSRADTAWVFPMDFDERVDKNAAGQNTPLVAVYATEDTTFVRSSREKLYGAMFEEVSYSLFTQFVRAELPNGATISDEALRASYAKFTYDDGMVDFVFMDSAQASLDGANYLTSPLRGLLMTMMLFCGLAATMVFKNDEKKRVFSTLPAEKRLLVFFGNNLAALSIAAVFVTAALVLSGLYTDILRESVMMGLFILAAAGVCTLVGALSPSNHVMGALLPVLLIASVALSPVFFNLRVGALRFALPGYYYLYGMNDWRYIWSFAVYALAVYGLATAVYILRAKREER